MIPDVYLFICLSVCQQDYTKGHGRIWRKLSGMLDVARLRGAKILVMIRISIWIQDRIEGFFTIATMGKSGSNMVLPPGEHS